MGGSVCNMQTCGDCFVFSSVFLTLKTKVAGLSPRGRKGVAAAVRRACDPITPRVMGGKGVD